MVVSKGNPVAFSRLSPAKYLLMASPLSSLPSAGAASSLQSFSSSGRNSLNRRSPDLRS